MRFAVAPEVFSALPDVCFGVVVARGIDNTQAVLAVDALLEAGIAAAEAAFREAKVKEHPAILPYRRAFEALGMNPNKFMSSIEALFTRVSKGKGLPRINPIVDLGNAVSLQFVLPIGAHDIGQMDADIEIRPARAGDSFLPFGETDPETPNEGEIVYVVGDKVRTRRWIWRQSELGKIGPTCRDVFFPIDGFVPDKENVLAARDDLAAHCRAIFGCEVAVGYVDARTPFVAF